MAARSERTSSAATCPDCGRPEDECCTGDGCQPPLQDKSGRVGSESIVWTLRDASKWLGGWWRKDERDGLDLRLLLHEAADEIERLRGVR